MPVYETPADQLAEQQIADAVKLALGLAGVGKLPLHYILDRVAIRDDAEITGFFEIKDRSRAFGDGNGGLYLSLNKVLNGHLLTAATGVPCRLVVRFAGGDIRWCPLDAYDRDVGVFWFARAGRPPEPCVTFPWAVFKQLPAPATEAAA